MDQTLDRLFEKFKHKQLTLKRLLLDIQASVGILTVEHLEKIETDFKIKREEMDHWIRITKSLKLYPKTQHYIKVCHTGNCGCKVDDAYYQQLLDIEQKHPDHLLMIEVGCLGVCPLGPNVIFDNQIYDHANTNGVLINKLRGL